MSATWIAAVSVLGALLGGGGIVALVRIAVASSDRRADDWREIARTNQAAAALSSEQVTQLIPAVQQLAAAQREVLALLQTAPERRGAA